MAKFCPSCGKSLDDAVQFCDGCGAPQNAAGANPAGAAPNTGAAGGPAAKVQEVFAPEDIEKNKVMAGLAYILFFLPLVACPDSRFGRFHANQGLLLLILSVGGSIISSIIPILGWFILAPILCVVVLVFAIMGLVNGLNGKAKELPLIGKFRIIK